MESVFLHRTGWGLDMGQARHGIPPQRDKGIDAIPAYFWSVYIRIYNSTRAAEKISVLGYVLDA